VQATITAPATEAARQWQGWGTALKPALEPITVARKPLIGTVAENVLMHGTGALNIDGCRVEGGPIASAGGTRRSGGIMGASEPLGGWESEHTGRWPANLIISYPENEYLCKKNLTKEQKEKLYEWLNENT
jgi:site-specific DNA-methyltransferase (adenine-specific)